MIVFTIILGLSLYPGHCYKANDAISTRLQSRNSQLYYNNANYQPSQDIYYNDGAKLNNNYNSEPSQNSNYNYEHSQNSNYNYEASQNSHHDNVSSQNSSHNYARSQNRNYNYAPSPNSNNNYAPSPNSNNNYAPSQNSNNNYAPSPNSNNNYAPSPNSNNNYAPSPNSNNNYAPSQNANLNNKLNFNSYDNMTYAGAGLYGGQPIRLVNLTQIIASQPYETISNIDRYRYPVAYNAEIGGTPVPMFREYPNYRQFDELSRDHQTISKIYRYPNSVPHSAEIGGKPVPMFRDYPNPSVLPPVNVMYPNLPPFEDSQHEKILGFGHIESRNNNMTIAASPDDLGFDDNPSLPEMVDGRFLWQVSVFNKEVSPFVRVCGGSLVTSSAVISAARCFWSVGPLSAELFAAGAGETVPGQANNYEAYQYQRNVRDIRLPPRFRGGTSSFHDDLAVVVLARPLPAALRPVCVSFDWELDEQQLAEGSEGTVLDVKLRTQRVPYVGPEECLRRTPEHQLDYITSDKICVGLPATSPTVCTFDTGSGLVYQDYNSIPYLRGVASYPFTVPCTTLFTHVGTHRAFLLRHLSGLEAECARHYAGAGRAVKSKGEGDEFVCNCYC